ncbi:uncharacterized protein PFLUO_LOCUS4094 [Penicillium psychrofluorescens]|uniref:uncharacterized protein n=1 Tax=Penicillium psychrofluorescens TaxID=3158075 RepID=UPI003CCCD0B8
MSATGDFGPAPLGVNLADNQNSEMLGAVVTLMIVGTLAVILRIYTRTSASQAYFGIDDYLVFAALVFAYGTGICVLISTKYKNGWHIQALTNHEFIVVWRLLFAHVMIYATTVSCTKASIIMFYHRIFNLQYSLWITLSIIAGYFVSVIITMVVACRPVAYFWFQYTNPAAEGSCIDVPEFFLVNGVIAVLIDLMILCVPVPIIWNLQMPRSQRAAVIGILFLGGFVCVAGIVRVVVLTKNTDSDDPSWSIAPVFAWSCVEPFIGIVCACLPTFSPIFRRWWETLVPRRNVSGKKGYHGPEGSGIWRIKREKGRSAPNGSALSQDEVELTHFPGWPAGTLRTRESREQMVSPHARIQIKEEVTITWA